MGLLLRALWLLWHFVPPANSSPQICHQQEFAEGASPQLTLISPGCCRPRDTRGSISQDLGQQWLKDQSLTKLPSVELVDG